MSDRTIKLADEADSARLKAERLYERWSGAAQLRAALLATRDDSQFPRWLSDAAEDIIGNMWQEYEAASTEHRIAMQAYLAASAQERPYLKEQAAARAAERAAAQ